MLKIIFMGTPAYSVPTLQSLIQSPDIEVCAVVAQPDKPAGRGRQIVAPPVKVCAQQHHIPVFQPEKLKTQEMYDALSAFEPDFLITIAYGKILRQNFLDIPKIAPLNLHASLLPKLRGAAPVQWSIINGDTQTGVCLMRMDAGMDTGPVYARQACPIESDETPDSLFEKLSRISADLLMQSIFDIARGKMAPVPQEGEATMAPMLQKNMGAIRFDTDAHTLDCLCRGIAPWPTAFVNFNGKRLSIHMTSAVQADVSQIPGTILGLSPDGQSLQVACKSSILQIHSLQIEGKKRMDAASFYHGYRPKDALLKAIENP